MTEQNREDCCRRVRPLSSYKFVFLKVERAGEPQVQGGVTEFFLLKDVNSCVASGEVSFLGRAIQLIGPETHEHSCCRGAIKPSIRDDN